MAYTTPNNAVYNGHRHTSTYNHTKKDWGNKLQQEVADGQLTSQQDQMIQQEFKSLHQSQGSMKNMSASQRHTARQNDRSQMQAWAGQNGIPSDLM